MKYKESAQTTKKRETYKPTVVLEQSPLTGTIKRIVKNNLGILRADNKLREILSEGVRFSTKKTRNLGNILPSGKRSLKKGRTWLFKQGMHKCNSAKCSTCKMVQETTHFWNKRKQKQFIIKQHYNCASTHAIYKIDCNICDLAYVGSTIRSVRTRISEHIRDIIKPSESRSMSMASKHFVQQHAGALTGFQFTVIDSIKHNEKVSELRKLEVKWMYALNTLFPAGLNQRNDLFTMY